MLAPRRTGHVVAINHWNGLVTAAVPPATSEGASHLDHDQVGRSRPVEGERCGMGHGELVIAGLLVAVAGSARSLATVGAVSDRARVSACLAAQPVVDLWREQRQVDCCIRPATRDQTVSTKAPSLGPGMALRVTRRGLRWHAGLSESDGCGVDHDGGLVARTRIGRVSPHGDGRTPSAIRSP